MNFQDFISQSGLKVLAIANFSKVELKVILYLLNNSASRMDEFITNSHSLRAALNVPDIELLDQALSQLCEQGVIFISYDNKQMPHPDQTMLISINCDVKKWNIDQKESFIDSADTIIYPFIRDGKLPLEVVDGDKSPEAVAKKTASRIVRVFEEHKALDEQEVEEAFNAARKLIESHPVDQILILTRHFGARFESLEDLHKSWNYYQDLFENESKSIDLQEEKIEHFRQDTELRENATSFLKNSYEDLTEDERLVLEIFIKHNHPRRQLFWANQSRSRYPNLKAFFEDNEHLMLHATPHHRGPHL